VAPTIAASLVYLTPVVHLSHFLVCIQLESSARRTSINLLLLKNALTRMNSTLAISPEELQIVAISLGMETAGLMIIALLINLF
jgi:hypothetical protein